MPDADPTPISRDAFARLLGSPKIAATAFFPVDRAVWAGDRYTLGREGARLPKGQFAGVRLQAVDPRNIDQSRERAVQTDLAGLSRSLAEIRKTPALAGAVLSEEVICGKDPSGVPRARFGLMCPPSGQFNDDAAAARHCHEQIMRAIRRCGLRSQGESNFDASQGFAGLEAWASRVRLQPPFYAPYMGWAKAAAAAAVVAAALWAIPAAGSLVVGSLRSAYTFCTEQVTSLWEWALPTLHETNYVDASDGQFTEKVLVRWADIPKATGYQVFRDDQEAPVATVSGTAPQQFDDVSAPVGKPLRYSIKGTTMLVSGPAGGGDSGFRNCMPPEGVTASAGSFPDRVAVSWKPVEHATGYQVFRDGSPCMTTTDTKCQDTDAPVGVLCRYVVKATTDAGASQPSSPAAEGFRAPTPPDGLVASDGTSPDAVKVAWNIPQGAEAYELVRNGPDGTKTFRCRSNSHMDTDAIPGQKYRYSVKTVTPHKTSRASKEDEGWREFEKPVVKASDGTFTDKVTISWNAVPLATSYKVFRDSVPLPTEVPQQTSNKLSLHDAEAVPGTAYKYSVQAVVANGDAPASDPDKGWRSLRPPASVTATPGNFTDKVIVSWSPVDGAARYRLLRDEEVITTTDNSSVTEYEDKNAAIGQLYKYSVESVCSLGSGPPSAPSAGYRDLLPPADVTATSGEFTDKVVISWKPVIGATGYQIFRSGTKAAIGFTFRHDDTTFEDVQVPSDGKFTYVVKAKTATVTGPLSKPSGEGFVTPNESPSPPSAGETSQQTSGS